jgi:hypothetical protein
MMLRHVLSFLLLSACATAASARPWPSSFPIEPVDLPPSVQQGVDLIYIDQEIAPVIAERSKLLAEIGLEDKLGSPVDLLLPLHPIYTDLRRGLMSYRAEWGAFAPGRAGFRTCSEDRRQGRACGSAPRAARACLRATCSMKAWPRQCVVISRCTP